MTYYKKSKQRKLYNSYMEERIDTIDELQKAKQRSSFLHAIRGIVLFFKITRNAWIELGIMMCVIVLGFLFHISLIEWVMIVLVSGLVFTAEAFNTAIEIDMNLTSPTYHPYVRDTKDVAAGAVLIAACIAVCVGTLIFSQYLF